MQPNLSRLDATIRMAAGAAFLVLAGILAGNLLPSLGAALTALLLVATALTRRCPIYALLGVSTGRPGGSP